MQKQELNASYFIAIQATYEGINLALCKVDTVLEQLFISKFDASRLVLVVLEQLLRNQGITLAVVEFIVVNRGPGPFTTLRTVLATVNGLAFASGTPLVGVDGILTLAAAYQKERGGIVVALLNAFNQDVYYAIAQQDTIIEVGCKNGLVLMQQLSVQFSDSAITFVGNGVQLVQAEIKGTFGSRAILVPPTVHTASIEQIAAQGVQQWRDKQNVEACLMPLYLKQHSAELK
jgi:tRNA threonylcarbamoyl adenosine modification protein YeaZ